MAICLWQLSDNNKPTSREPSRRTRRRRHCKLPMDRGPWTVDRGPWTLQQYHRPLDLSRRLSTCPLGSCGAFITRRIIKVPSAPHSTMPRPRQETNNTSEFNQSDRPTSRFPRRITRRSGLPSYTRHRDSTRVVLVLTPRDRGSQPEANSSQPFPGAFPQAHATGHLQGSNRADGAAGKRR
jgi:hypothetical protein